MPSGEVRVCCEELIEPSPIDEEPELEDQDATPGAHDMLRPWEADNRRWTFSDSAKSPRHNLNPSATPTGVGSTHSYRSRPRASTMMRLGASGLPPNPKSKPWPTHRRSESDLGSRGRSLFIDHERLGFETRGRQALSRPPRSSASPTFAMRRPDSSNGSTSTVIQAPFDGPDTGHESYASATRVSASCEAGMSPPPVILVPDALEYLDEGSPEVTEEAIRRSVEEAGAASSTPWHFAPPLGSSRSSTRGSPCRPSHRTTSPHSPGMSSAASATSCSEMVGDDPETDRSSSPERSVNGNGDASERESPVKGDFLTAPEFRQPRNLQELQKLEQEISRQHHNRYGTPEMPRGRASIPPSGRTSIPPRALNPRGPSQEAMNLPRAEKLPLSGYELLASCLSGPEHCLGWHESDHNQQQPPVHRTHRRHASMGPPAGSVGMPAPSPWLQPHQQHPSIKPIYRRFQALSHRVLLNLQDELSVLEEQLHRLDTADTQARRMQSHIIPASRRGDNPRGGELQVQKTEVLQKIEVKLGQYNQALESFTKTQGLSVPSTKEVDNYRTYFAMENPINEMETRFLDCPYDLISLAPDEKPSAPVFTYATATTRIGRSRSRSDLPLRNHHYATENYKQDQASDDNNPTPVQGQTPFRASSPTPTVLYHHQRPDPARSLFATSRPSPLSRPPTTAANAHRRIGSNLSTRSPGLADCLSSSYPTDRTDPGSPMSTMSLHDGADAKPDRAAAARRPVVRVVVAGTAAVLAPVSAFTVIPGFASRMAVVLLVLALAAVVCGGSGWARRAKGAATAAAAIDKTAPQAATESIDDEVAHEGKQAEGPAAAAALPVAAASYSVVGGFSTQDLLLCAGAYGGVMAVIAGSFA
ncbi:hypothetical protein RB601_005127 [Gaeumannomyces tritici]